jgi:hypothetical protein
MLEIRISRVCLLCAALFYTTLLLEKRDEGMALRAYVVTFGQAN